MSEAQNHEALPRMGGAVRWVLDTDLRMAVITGLLFVGGLFLVMLPWMHFEREHQAKSYGVALHLLEGRSLREMPAQRAALLTKKDGVYFWRAVVWARTQTGERPYMFTARVDKNQDYRVIESTWAPYDPDNTLGLFVNREVSDK